MSAPASPPSATAASSAGAAGTPAAAHTIEIQQAIAADNGDALDDSDSAPAEETESSLVSLSSSILAYQEEHGRRYHALSRGKYPLPNDDTENERLDLQHGIYLRTLEGQLALCPGSKTAKRVLDMGTGTGAWALDFADEHPDAEVIGVDLSPIQPDFVPANVSFEIDDLEKEWTWPKKFDFIFSRMMLGCFENLPATIKQAYDHLEPGGYMELEDLALPLRSDDGTLAPDSYISRWCDLCYEAGVKLNRPVFPVPEYKNYLEAAGFVDIVEVQKKWPTNAWPRDTHFKELGTWTYANLAGGLDGLTMAHFTRGLGWTPEQVTEFCAAMRKELKSPRIHAYWPIYCVYGRKPEAK